MWKMKCIALFTSFVVAALAEPEPYFGRLGYAGIGLPVSGYGGYANAYGLGPIASRSYVSSAPIVTRPHVRTVAPAVSAYTPAVAPVAPVVSPVVAPYASTATLKAVPAAPSTLQFHKQDEFGNYEYGYDNVNSAKKETGNAKVGVTGSYTVKDLQGVRTVNYVADAFGYRASPAHGRKKRSAFYPYGNLLSSYQNVYNSARASPLAYSVATAAPISTIPHVRTVAPTMSAYTPAVAPVAPVVSPAVSPYASTATLKAVPAAPSTSQFHRQDEFGNYDYGYNNIHSGKFEGGNVQTGVTGGYRYRDSYGIERSFQYVADGLGFRVSPTHLRHKRNAAYVASDSRATIPGTMMVIQYNPGFSTGYRLYHY